LASQLLVSAQNLSLQCCIDPACAYFTKKHLDDALDLADLAFREHPVVLIGLLRADWLVRSVHPLVCAIAVPFPVALLPSTTLGKY
jgi:hypothetical protein